MSYQKEGKKHEGEDEETRGRKNYLRDLERKKSAKESAEKIKSMVNKLWKKPSITEDSQKNKKWYEE